MRRLLQHWTESSITPASREWSVWMNKKPRKWTVSFVEDRSLTWSTSTSGSLESCRPIYSCSSKWWYSGVRFKNGTEFYYQWRKSHLMTSWKDCTNEEYESLRTSRPYWNCTIWRFIRRKLDLIITDWRHGKREVSSRIYESRILKPETEMMKERSGQESGDKTAWTKMSRRLLAVESQRAVF